MSEPDSFYSDTGSIDPMKLLDHFEGEQVYQFWVIKPKHRDLET